MEICSDTDDATGGGENVGANPGAGNASTSHHGHVAEDVAAPIDNPDGRGGNSDSDDEIIPVPRSRRTITGRVDHSARPSARSAYVTDTGSPNASSVVAPENHADQQKELFAAGTERQYWPRRGTLDSDLYCIMVKDVKRGHGEDARVMDIQLHADEALVFEVGCPPHFSRPRQVRARAEWRQRLGNHWLYRARA